MKVNHSIFYSFVVYKIDTLISNAQKTITMQTMIDNGVPKHLAQKAAGDVYDPVHGIGEADPNIWGPEV